MELKIFVNTWRNYNINGADGGAWLSLPMGTEELEEKLGELAEKIGDNSPEWFVNDFESGIAGFSIDENDDILELNELAEELDELDEWEEEKLAAILEWEGVSPRRALETMDRFDFYSGITLEELAEQLTEECSDIPDHLANYIDYEAMARDMSFEGYHETQNGVLFCY